MTDKIQYSHILVRIASEIFLKGKNQNSFVNKLRENIKKLTGQSQISKGRGRMLIPFFEGHQKLQRVFGVHSYSLAAFIPKKEDSDEDNILPEVVRDEILKIDRVLNEQHFTQPPPRYSEASLVKKL